MPDLMKLLSRFNRKERFFLVGQALGNKEFSLAASFREELSKVIGIKVPSGTFAAMDYHLDWIAASLWAYQHPEFIDKPNLNSTPVATGTQQDIDLLIAFKRGDQYSLVLLEAKAYGSWDNKQMHKKSQRLKEIWGCTGDKYLNVKPFFCLVSPRKPSRLETNNWPTWMKKDGTDPYYWMKLNLEYPRFNVAGCNSSGKPSKERSYFRITKIQSPKS